MTVSDLDIVKSFGDCLRDSEFSDWKTVQKFINMELEGGHFLPRKRIEDVITSLEESGFLNKIDNRFTYKHKEVYHTQIIRNVLPALGGGLPDWSREDDFEDKKELEYE